MAQARVTEFYATKKRNADAQPSKRRKLQIAQAETDEILQIHSLNTRSTRSSARKKEVIPDINKTEDPENALFTLSKEVSKPAAKTAKHRSRKIKQVKGQKTLAYTLHSQSPTQTLSTEEVTSTWDEHDGPLTPSKRTKQNEDGQQTIHCKKRSQRHQAQLNVATPKKEQQEEEIKAPRSRKKLQLRQNVITSSESENSENESVLPVPDSEKNQFRESLVFPSTPPAISPIPDTPEVVRQQTAKGPDTPMSNKVKEAMAKIKQLNTVSDASPAEVSKTAVKGLKKCGKLEDLKAQLMELKHAKDEISKLKNLKKRPSVKTTLKPAAPELKKFGSIDVKVESTSETPSSEEKLPAYQRFHHLATPAAPSLLLPYGYKLLEDMFSSMETIVRMLNNRSEVCTFSKLKTAVQEMTKRNFVEKNIGQVKTVYPEAYMYRQEKGFPSFGNKVTGYQLTIEPNLIEDNSCGDKVKSGKPNFTAKHVLERKSTFHSKLISIVMNHHKKFLSTLSPPLTVPDDKITRWHPKFSLDEVPEIEASSLPEPPYVKKYQSAKDVLEDTRGKLPERVEKALTSVSMSSEKTADSAQETLAIKKLPQYQGVPQSLLEKIRAKEAKKLEAAMMRNPVEDKRVLMLRRLPDMMRILRTHFVTEKKPALPMENVVQKLTDSCKSSIRSDDVETHIKLMLEVAPEWLKMVEIKKGKYLKMDRNIDLVTLQFKVTNMAK